MIPVFSRSSRRRRPFMGLVAGLVAGAVLLGGGGAWAYWTANATASSTVKTTKVAITQVNFPNASKTYLNTLTSLSNTGSFKVKNTGAAAGTVKVTITSPDAFASKLDTVIWTTDDAAKCTDTAAVPAAPASATGKWESMTLNSTASLAADKEQIYCVRTTLTGGKTLANAMNYAHSSGTILATATLKADLTTAGWTATDTTGVATQKTEAIYPLATDYRPVGLSDWYDISTGASSTGRCFDVASGGKVNGTAVNAYTCTQNDNQAFQITPVAGSSPQAVTLRPMHAWEKYVAMTAPNGTTLMLADAKDAQSWVIQTRGNGQYQLVHPTTGKCFNMTTSALADCNQAGAAVYLNRKAITFTTTASGMQVDMPIRNVYTAMRFQFGSSFLIIIPTWTTIGTVSAQSAPVKIDVAPPFSGMSNGTEYPARLLLGASGLADSQTAWSGKVTRANSGSGLSITGGNG